MVWYSDHWLAFLMYVPAALAGLLATQVGGLLTNRFSAAQSLHHCTCQPVSHSACPGPVVQAAGCKVLRLDLSNSLLGMALVMGSLASLLTSLQLGSAFLFAAWAAAALLGMPAAGRVS